MTARPRIQLTEKDKRKVRLSKIDAAKGQLDAAIELWFHGGNEAAIHTLLFASYQVISDLNKKRGTGTDSLYAPPSISPEYQDEWRRAIRAAGRFLKHAENDPDAILEFYPFTNHLFILYAISGLHALNEEVPNSVLFLGIWLALHEPHIMAPNARKAFEKRVPAEELSRIERMTKKEFLKQMTNGVAFHTLRRHHRS
jgi:hypothetical protein